MTTEVKAQEPPVSDNGGSTPTPSPPGQKQGKSTDTNWRQQLESFPIASQTRVETKKKPQTSTTRVWQPKNRTTSPKDSRKADAKKGTPMTIEVTSAAKPTPGTPANSPKNSHKNEAPSHFNRDRTNGLLGGNRGPNGDEPCYDPKKPMPLNMLKDGSKFIFMPRAAQIPINQWQVGVHGLKNQACIQQLLEEPKKHTNGQAGATHPVATLVRGFTMLELLTKVLTTYPLVDVKISKSLKRFTPVDSIGQATPPFKGVWFDENDLSTTRESDVDLRDFKDKVIILEHYFKADYDLLFERCQPREIISAGVDTPFIMGRISPRFDMYSEHFKYEGVTETIVAYRDAFKESGQFAGQSNASIHYKRYVDFTNCPVSQAAKGSADWKQVNTEILNSDIYSMQTIVKNERQAHVETRKLWHKIPQIHTSHGTYLASHLNFGDMSRNLQDYRVTRYTRLKKPSTLAPSPLTSGMAGILIERADGGCERMSRKSYNDLMASATSVEPKPRSNALFNKEMRKKVLRHLQSPYSRVTVDADDFTLGEEVIEQLVQAVLDQTALTYKPRGEIDVAMLNLSSMVLGEDMIFHLQRLGLLNLFGFLMIPILLVIFLQVTGLDGMRSLKDLIMTAYNYSFLIGYLFLQVNKTRLKRNKCVACTPYVCKSNCPEIAPCLECRTHATLICVDSCSKPSAHDYCMMFWFSHVLVTALRFCGSVGLMTYTYEHIDSVLHFGLRKFMQYRIQSFSRVSVADLLLKPFLVWFVLKSKFNWATKLNNRKGLVMIVIMALLFTQPVAAGRFDTFVLETVDEEVSGDELYCGLTASEFIQELPFSVEADDVPCKINLLARELALDHRNNLITTMAETVSDKDIESAMFIWNVTATTEIFIAAKKAERANPNDYPIVLNDPTEIVITSDQLRTMDKYITSNKDSSLTRCAMRTKKGSKKLSRRCRRSVNKVSFVHKDSARKNTLKSLMIDYDRALAARDKISIFYSDEWEKANAKVVKAEKAYDRKVRVNQLKEQVKDVRDDVLDFGTDIYEGFTSLIGY